ncbi:MAG: hypothetical protein LC105_07835 [Chitinophagales bacterium]|nr:hypothetical protein [Chitinophagales bacterium]MCZ2393748.1 hypothetical protein [Chitinophagales bacterium]
MANLESFKKNWDLFISDVKIQVESVKNDIKVLPETIEQLASNSQVLLGQAKAQLQTISAEFQNGNLLKKDFKPQIKKVTVELQTAVIKMLDSVKHAIEKAK